MQNHGQKGLSILRKEPEIECPICNRGTLQARIDKNVFEMKGKNFAIDLHYSVCNTCGSEQVNASQMQANKDIMKMETGYGKRFLVGETAPRSKSS